MVRAYASGGRGRRPMPNQYLSVDHHVPLWAPRRLGALLRRNVQDQGAAMGASMRAWVRAKGPCLTTLRTAYVPQMDRYIRSSASAG